MARLLAFLVILEATAQPAASYGRPAAAEPRVQEQGADAAFAEAKKAFLALRKDEKRRRFRDQWLSVVAEFEQIAERFPKSRRAADALFDTAQVYAELSHVSRAHRDLKAAIDAYERLCQRYPSSNLADDAHLALGRLHRDRRGDTEAARAEFEAAVASKGDMAGKARQALAALGPPPKPEAVPAKEAKPERPTAARLQEQDADAAFAEAKKAFLALRKDEKRRRFRDQWLSVVAKFEQIAERFPKSRRAADALFDAAELHAELSHVSLARRDLKAAIDAYERLCQRYPSSNLADDAHLALGWIHRDRRGDTEAARAEFEAAVASKGDMAGKARQALAALGPPPKPEAALAKEAKPERPKAAADTGDDSEDDEDEDETAAAPSAALDAARVRVLRSAARADVPLSVQAGLKIRRIIIDPGHGGQDAGATGPGGLREKDAALAISLALKEELEARGFEALLTRDSDAFVSLDDRTRFANRKKGDLFLSVHCNAFKSPELRGVETYTLDVASDAYAIRLAARENASSERKISDLQFILADLATRANTDESLRLARAVQSSLLAAQSEPKKPMHDLGVKQSLFYVLLGAKMPAVLVETAFISNPADERRLGEPRHQRALGRAIAEGVVRFGAERELFAKALTD
jgi:N-acetylmuramoyl-L-alanine amidase